MRIARLFAAIVLVLASVTSVEAARVSPMVLTLDAAGRGSTGRIEVANTDNDPMPMEVRMFRGTITEAGELTLEPADAEFLVYPPQGVIEAQRQQFVRVQYIGEPDLPMSQVFYASVREVPVDIERTGVNVQIVSHFNVLVNVVPEGTTAQPMVDSVKPETRDGVTGVVVRIVNEGTRFFAAGRSEWRLTGNDEAGNPFSLTVPRTEIGGIIGYGIVPPQGARLFFLPTETLLAEGSARLELKS